MIESLEQFNFSFTNLTEFNEYEKIFANQDDFMSFPWYKMVVIITMIQFMIFGIPANSFIIFVSMSVKRRISVSQRFLLINLAISDLILLLNAPLKVCLEWVNYKFAEIGPAWSRVFICKYYHGIKQVCFFTSILTIALTAGDRYWVITTGRRPDEKCSLWSKNTIFYI